MVDREALLGKFNMAVLADVIVAQKDILARQSNG